MRYTFDYTVQPDGTAALARVYGEEPVLVLPETLPGPEGQPLPLARLGSYCFSGTVREPDAGAAVPLRMGRGGTHGPH